MKEIEEVKIKIKDNFCKIMLLCFFVIVLFYFIFYFGLYPITKFEDIRNNLDQAYEFKGFPSRVQLDDDPQQYKPISENIEKTDDHFIVYGKTKSGKTYFITKYIKQYYKPENVYIFCLQKEEWKDFKNIYESDDLNKLEDMESFKGTKENPSLILLDDMGNLMNQKDTSEIFTKGRHLHIQIIVLAHKACDVDNKIRGNINTFYTTTRNNPLFFDELNSNYRIKFPLLHWRKIRYGIIKIDMMEDKYIVYDKDLQVAYDSETNVRNVYSGFNIEKYLNVTKFSEEDKDEIIFFLEKESGNTISITDETFLFYLNYYFMQVLKVGPNLSKIKKIVTNSLPKYNLSEMAGDVASGMKSVKPVINEIKNF
jgi:hypothetical protein